MKMMHTARVTVDREVVEADLKTLPLSKAKGAIFSRFTPVDYLHLTFDLNLASNERYELEFGDLYPLKEFVELCQNGVFLDSDGGCNEILLHGKVVWSKALGASDIDFYSTRLKQLDWKHNGKLLIAWYNK